MFKALAANALIPTITLLSLIGTQTLTDQKQKQNEPLPIKQPAAKDSATPDAPQPVDVKPVAEQPQAAQNGQPTQAVTEQPVVSSKDEAKQNEVENAQPSPAKPRTTQATSQPQVPVVKARAEARAIATSKSVAAPRPTFHIPPKPLAIAIARANHQVVLEMSYVDAEGSVKKARLCGTNDEVVDKLRKLPQPLQQLGLQSLMSR